MGLVYIKHATLNKWLGATGLGTAHITPCLLDNEFAWTMNASTTDITEQQYNSPIYFSINDGNNKSTNYYLCTQGSGNRLSLSDSDSSLEFHPEDPGAPSPCPPAPIAAGLDSLFLNVDQNQVPILSLDKVDWFLFAA